MFTVPDRVPLPSSVPPPAMTTVPLPVADPVVLFTRTIRLFSTVRPQVKVLAPASVSTEVSLSCRTAVTFGPMTPPITTAPVPVPSLTICPVIFGAPETVMPLAKDEEFRRIKSPVWVIAPERTIPLPATRDALSTVRFPVPSTAPSVSLVPPPLGGSVTVKVGEPLRVVAPKTSPAVPLVTRFPAFTSTCWSPMASVPSVNVTPAPAVVRRSTVMSTSADTVVLRLVIVRAALLASSRLPPASSRDPAPPRASASVVARRMPPSTRVGPVKVLPVPAKVSIPLPILVSPTVPEPLTMFAL